MNLSFLNHGIIRLKVSYHARIQKPSSGGPGPKLTLSIPSEQSGVNKADYHQLPAKCHLNGDILAGLSLLDTKYWLVYFWIIQG